jgi:hypothetical protein
MAEIDQVLERSCPACGRLVPHTYSSRLVSSGRTATGTPWRTLVWGWMCTACQTLEEKRLTEEQFDTITGEWLAETRGVRIPVRGLPLRVRVTEDDGRSWIVTGIDLSTSGILVEFGPSRTPDLVIGAKLHVSLAFESHLVDVAGNVRRRHDREYGVAFEREPTERDTFRPDPLRMLVAALEQRWLATRIR